MSSDSLIDALRSELAADPNNTQARSLLAATLLKAGDSAAALAETDELLRRSPDDLGALSLAEQACRSTGDHERADRYRRLAELISGSTNQSAADPKPELPTPLITMPDTVDELVDQWSSASPFAEPEVGELSAPTLTLDGVSGLVDVKERLDRTLFGPLRNPELAAAFGTSVRGGLVLYGPPGCGKTFLAKAIAGELGARFYSVALNDVLDMYIGSSERNVHDLFEVARAHAPCVLFLDEIDALGMKRTNMAGHSAMRPVVNQLLTELDGVSSRNEGVFLLGATNHPWDVDSAVLRPGRLGSLVFVPPPDYQSRAQILNLALVDRPTFGLDLGAVATATNGYSGADLVEVATRAVEEAMQLSLQSGSLVPVDQPMLQRAFTSVKPSIGPWISMAKNVATFSNTSGQYDDLVAWLKENR